MDGRIRFLRAICWSHPSVSPAPAPCPDGGGHVALPADLQKTRHKQCKLQCTFPRCLHPGTNMHRDLILSLGITSLHGQAFSTVRPIIKCAVTRMRRYLNRAVCLSSSVALWRRLLYCIPGGVATSHRTFDAEDAGNTYYPDSKLFNSKQ